MAMNWLGDNQDDSGNPGPSNQRPYDPNNPSPPTGLYPTPQGQTAPGTGTTPSGMPVQPQDSSFKYDFNQKPGTNALDYLGTQLFGQTTPPGGQSTGGPPQGMNIGGGGTKGSSQAGALSTGNGLTTGEGKNQGGIMKLAGSIGMDMG